MTRESRAPTRVLLVGTDDPLLEGLAQAFAAHGFAPQVVGSLLDAAESAAESAALLVVIDHALAAESFGDTMAITLAPGGSLVLYSGTEARTATPAALQRCVLAELMLPLERARLMALARTVADRAAAAGRPARRKETPPEASAIG